MLTCGPPAISVVAEVVLASADGTTKAMLASINDNIKNFFILSLHVRFLTGTTGLIIGRPVKTFS